jgi:Ca2+:H+ antiporter
VAVLAGSAAALAVTSEVLTGAVEPTAARLGLTPVFAGVFLLATVGNLSGLINAVRFARRDRMDLTVSVTMGAGTQVALLVAPVLVLAGQLMGRPMDLLFSRFEVVAIAIAVLVGRTITVDGESNWLEGVMLVAVYTMLGVGFYYLNGP